MPKKRKLHEVKIGSDEYVEEFLPRAFQDIENADNIIENQYIIKLTDAEKLILHLALQTAHLVTGNPRSILEVMSKAVNMEKVSKSSAELN
jgi:hypothetical protein